MFLCKVVIVIILLHYKNKLLNCLQLQIATFIHKQFLYIAVFLILKCAEYQLSSHQN